MSTTTDYMTPDRLARAHNIESWAIRHGYLFYNNVMNPQDFASVSGVLHIPVWCSCNVAILTLAPSSWTQPLSTVTAGQKGCLARPSCNVHDVCQMEMGQSPCAISIYMTNTWQGL